MSKRILVGINDYSKTNKYLNECLDSLKAQTLQDFDVEIDSRETVESHAPAFTKWNDFINKATAGGYEYLFLPGEDDIPMPTLLSESIAFLEKNPDIAFVSSMSYEIDESGNRLPDVVSLPSVIASGKPIDFKTLFFAFIKYGNFIRFPSIVYRMNLIKDTLFTISQTLLGAADCYWYFDVLSKRRKCAILDKRLIKIRNHNQQYTQAQRENGAIDHFEAMDMASYLDTSVRTWEINALLTKLIAENVLRRQENALREKEKTASNVEFVIVHLPPGNNGTELLSAQMVKDISRKEDTIAYYVFPNPNDTSIMNRFYKGMLVISCKPELLKSAVDRYKPSKIHIQHLNQWRDDRDNIRFLFEEQYVEKVTYYLHDSCPIDCKRFHLIDNRNQICEGPETYKCSQCTGLGTRQLESDLKEAKQLLLKTKKLVANSKWTAENYKRWLNRNDIEIKEWEIPPLSRQIRCQKVGFFGTFSTVKGISAFLEAARMLPQYQFILFSDVPDEFLNGKSIHGIPNTLVLGSYKREDLPILTNIIDLAVVPSLIESYGITVRELMSLNIPTIATKTSGMVEIGTVEPDNPVALAKAIRNHFMNSIEEIKM